MSILEMYVYFMKDIETGFRIHLGMFVAKKNDIVVSCCRHCLHKILIKTCVTPNYPDDDVCTTFCKCYVKITEFLEGIILLGNCTTRRLLQHYHNTRYSFCESCIFNFILSLKNFCKEFEKIFGSTSLIVFINVKEFYAGVRKWFRHPM